jgi:hypothetical protein
LDVLFEKLQNNRDIGMYDLMLEDINQYLDREDIDKKDDEIEEKNKVDISIYLRY